MSRDRSFAAVKKAIGGGSSFSGKRNVLVSMGERTFLYKDVFVSATYNIAYMQMDIDVVWEDDSSQPDYRTLGRMGDTTVISKNFNMMTDISAGMMAPLLYLFCFNAE